MSESIQVPESLRVDSRSTRPVFVFDVPLENQHEVGIQSIGIVELTMDEERKVMAGMRGTSVGAAAGVQYNLVMASVQEINGKTLPAIGEARDTALGGLRPLARSLLTNAFASLHNPPKDLTQGFLKSRRMTAK